MKLPVIQRYGKEFNFVGPGIKCWADGVGAEVYEITTYPRWMDSVKVRVLAFSEADAQSKASDEMEDHS